MNLSSRVRQILLFLLHAQNPCTEQEIADALDVSKRTIQREWEDVESVLTKAGLTLTRIKNKGVLVEGTLEQKKELLGTLTEDTAIDVSSKEERRKHLLFELLRDRSPRKLYYYSDMLQVSEATVGTDMEALTPWLSQNHLEIVKRPGYGVTLTGSEKDYREAMRRFIHENMGHRLYGLAGESESFTSTIMESTAVGVYSLLSGDTLKRVHDVMQSLEEPKLKALEENAYIGLIFHIAIGIERIRQGGVIEENKEFAHNLESWEEYGLALRVLQAMEEAFEIHIPHVELSYILLHIRGAKVSYSGQKSDDFFFVEEDELLEILDEMIYAYDEELAYELKCDEDFVRGLLVHLRPTFVRLKNGMNIFNPILQDILTEYPEYFEKCSRAAQVITRHTGLPVKEEEVGYLTMHFVAAEERLLHRHHQGRKVQIGIVCASGFGVARLMMTKLSMELQDQAILQAYGKEELSAYVVSHTDFFITTMEMDRTEVDYLMVNPLIPERDLSRIRYKIEEYAHVEKNIEDEDFHKQLDAANFVTRAIKGILRRFFTEELPQDITFKKMVDVVSTAMAGSEDSAKALSIKLLEREKMNSQIFPELGICLLHCRTRLVREAKVACFKPDKGENFTDPSMKNINAVFVMLMPEEGETKLYGDILGYISSAFVSKKQFLDAVRFRNPGEILEALQHVLKDYFYDFLNQI